MTVLNEVQLLNFDSTTVECKNAKVALVGATRSDYVNTVDLRVMNYKEAMESPHRNKFEPGMDIEHAKLRKYGVVKEVDKSDLQPGDEIIDSTWANKLKPNSNVCCQVEAR